ncbi:MAG: peptidase S8 [Crocinitomicaceae bacterium]|nr:peptidase S8 [Crocinitomicaceae bacterium]|tara:strand:- start:26640 stop:28211 length:1572 start_codon:yes stop_codon:yes gene_type:complete
MNKIIFKFSLVTFSFIISNLTYSQVDKKVVNWYNACGAGMQTEKAYKKLKKRESETVIVAIIDSGIDIEHEDLKGKIWVNKDEIPDNGIDDDKNGYVDDVHGWNFLGNKSGENANDMRLEKTRILARLSEERKNNDLSPNDEKLYNKVKEEVASDRAKYEGYISRIDMMMPMISSIPSKVAKAIGKENYTVKDLKKWKPETNDMKQVKGMAIAILSGDLSEETMNGQKEYIQTMLDTHLNTDFDGRALVGDNPTDFTDTNYGNNDVEGPDALHGTHVGGIVGAIRGNSLGGDGVANDVLLMSLRAVPNGDEFDKDIALAIRYAVDNGAMIINMSFGKAYSPNKKEVYEAFKYADSKGVLCIHAAGNDHKDIDTEDNYPTSVYKSFQEKKFDHYLTIGSSTKDNKGNLPSTFSNFGKNGVDIFAPGSEIYNTVPQSEYKVLQGTSMACPMVSGAAAMLKSYFPKLSMKEIADVLLSTGTSYKGVNQMHPGTKKMDDFAVLSVTGSVVNLKNAVDKCLELEKNNK